MNPAEVLLQPFTLKNLTLRNRLMSTSHAPSYGVDGKPQERYQRYHEEKARGGIALTMFGGSSSVSLDSPAKPWNQLSFGDDSIVPFLVEFADRIHRHGAALMVQLTHMGRRTRWDTEHWLAPISSSPEREPAHRSIPKEMEASDIRRVIADFAAAARRCKQGRLDGLELSAAHGHLIDQFWSPSVNRRGDEYGGSLDHRMRFGIEVLEAVRAAVGSDFPVGLRVSGDELLERGLTIEDCVTIVRRYHASGLIDFVNVIGGQARDHLAHAVSLPNMFFPVGPFLHLASHIKREIGLPVFHAQRVSDVNSAARAIADGHVDMIGMTRAHIADPHIARKLAEGRADDIRQCVGAGYCIDRIYVGSDALCIQNPATGREALLPHELTAAATKRRVVIVGAGPAGLEAARICAGRGHRVTLLERRPVLGGQISIAALAGWREALSGITRWLEAQVRKSGAEVRLNTSADRHLILQQQPDVVIIATGGLPRSCDIEGGHLATSSWDALTGRQPIAPSVLLFDETGQPQGASTAEFAARHGASVEMVTCDRMIAEEVGTTNQPVHLRELYRLDVVLTPNCGLQRIYREDGKLVAVLRNEYTEALEERVVDQIIVERGTQADDALYRQLRADSVNHGEMDLQRFVRAEQQPLCDRGGYALFRIGDAVAARNIHAAMFDAARLCHAL